MLWLKAAGGSVRPTRPETHKAISDSADAPGCAQVCPGELFYTAQTSPGSVEGVSSTAQTRPTGFERAVLHCPNVSGCTQAASMEPSRTRGLVTAFI